jgi:hypothetical protein
MKVSIPTGPDAGMPSREGAQDDLVLALAIVLWVGAENTRVPVLVRDRSMGSTPIV